MISLWDFPLCACVRVQNSYYLLIPYLQTDLLHEICDPKISTHGPFRSFSGVRRLERNSRPPLRTVPAEAAQGDGDAHRQFQL